MDLSLNKLPWYAQVGLFVALAAAGVGAFYYLYAVPAERALEVQRKRLGALRVDISQGMAIAQQLPQFRAQVTDLEARLDGLKAILPDEKDFADLLRSLQTLAVQSNLTIKHFKPAPVVSKDLHAEWPINIELEGTFHNLGLFYDRISRFSRIINIGNTAIKAKDKPDQNTSVSVALVATTFVLTEPAKTAEPAAKPPAGRPAAAKPGGKS
ncbi:MAG: type 4a pilus biogenesis protein PilO [Vicinamibacterales bacterium]|jgi:type IV pilus assembly protein PilO|nr:type 4a pilus biogenesis protein PilO [Vicinamibacterales bacterium]